MADPVGKSEREDGGRRRGKVMIQGGKPKKKGNEAGKENAVGGDTECHDHPYRWRGLQRFSGQI